MALEEQLVGFILCGYLYIVTHLRHEGCATFSLEMLLQGVYRLDEDVKRSVTLLYVFCLHLSGLSGNHINCSNVIYMPIYSFGIWICPCGNRKCSEPWDKVFDAFFSPCQPIPFNSALCPPFTFECEL